MTEYHIGCYDQSIWTGCCRIVILLFELGSVPKRSHRLWRGPAFLKSKVGGGKTGQTVNPPAKAEPQTLFIIKHKLFGRLPKRSTGPDCKSGGLRLRRFESFTSHHRITHPALFPAGRSAGLRLYYTKLAPIFKTNNVARVKRGERKLNRTLR